MTDVNLINGIALASEEMLSTPYKTPPDFQVWLSLISCTGSDQVRSAKAQANLIMLEEGSWQKGRDIYKRGRNANSHTKNTNIYLSYVYWFEAVMGYLHMTEEIKRLEELIDWCVKRVEEATPWKQMNC